MLLVKSLMSLQITLAQAMTHSYWQTQHSCHLRGESPLGWAAVRGQWLSVKDMADDTFYYASNCA